MHPDRYRENCVGFTKGFVDWTQAKASIQQVWKGLPDLRVELPHVTTNGDVVLAQGTVRGTATGRLYGAPPTKRSFEANFFDYVQVDDDRIVERIQQSDILGMMRTLRQGDRNDRARRHVLANVTRSRSRECNPRRKGYSAHPARPGVAQRLLGHRLMLARPGSGTDLAARQPDPDQHRIAHRFGNPPRPGRRGPAPDRAPIDIAIQRGLADLLLSRRQQTDSPW